MKKYLVLNADDFGMCKSANEAVFELFKSGDLLSATIMMPCPAAEEAVQFSIDNPQYAIGIHTTLTSEWKKYRWKPLTARACSTPRAICGPRATRWRSTQNIKKLRPRSGRR